MSDSSDEVCDLKIYLLQKTQEKQFLMDLLRRSSYTFSFKSKKKEVRKSAFLEGEKATNIIKQFCGIDYEIHELC